MPRALATKCRRCTALCFAAAALHLAAPPALCAQANAQTDAPDKSQAEGGDTPPAWSLRLSAGLGMGSRAFDLPKDGVVYQTRTGFFPAFDLGFELDHRPSQALSVGLLGRYQSSVGLEIVEEHTDGSERPLGARSHRLDLGLAPSVQLDAAGRWRLAGALGYGLCDLRPEAHVQTPAYSLGGPFLRLTLQVPLWDEWLRLLLSPEGRWIARVGQELIDRGVGAQGLSAGGEAALQVAFGGGWLVEASYRELRAWLSSSQTQAFEDVSRFATLRLSGTL